MTKYASLSFKLNKLSCALISLALVLGFFLVAPLYILASNELVLAYYEFKLDRNKIPVNAGDYAAWWMDKAFNEIVTSKRTERSALLRKTLGITSDCDLKFLDFKRHEPDRVRVMGDKTYVHMYGTMFDKSSQNLNLLRFKAELMLENKSGRFAVTSVQIRTFGNKNSSEFLKVVSHPTTKKFIETNTKILKQLRYETAWKEVDKSRSLAELERAISLNDKCAYLYYYRAYRMNEEGNLEECLKDYSISVNLESHDTTDAITNRGSVKGELGDHAGALADLDLAIKRNPDNYFAYGLRGFENYSSERYEEAIKDYSKAIELDPGQYDYHCNRAIAYEKLGLNSWALLDYTQMVALEPKQYKGYYYRALLLMKMNLYAESLPDLDATLKLRPEKEKMDDFWIYHQRSIANSQSQRVQKAISDASKVIELRPDLPDGYWDRAFPEMKIGLHKKAIDDFTYGTSLQSDNSRAHLALGKLKKSAGDLVGALKSFDKAIELEKFTEGFVQRAAVKQELGYGASAQQDLIEAKRWE